MRVNDATRKLIRERAKYLCEYCHSSEEASAALFSIDHITPQSLGGSEVKRKREALAIPKGIATKIDTITTKAW
jgi:5-methylcytosine-specific restriction endonuclease McrA